MMYDRMRPQYGPRHQDVSESGMDVGGGGMGRERFGIGGGVLGGRFRPGFDGNTPAMPAQGPQVSTGLPPAQVRGPVMSTNTPPGQPVGPQMGGNTPPTQLPQMQTGGNLPPNLLSGGLMPPAQLPMQTGGPMPPNRLAMLPWWAGLGF